MTRGMVLGKFMPPHAGHVYLIEFARRFADDLSVVVGTLAAEPIAGELRYRWVRELFPDVRVIHLTDENPQYPEEHPDFWEIWRRSLVRVLPAPPELVFASEAYGPKLAEVLGARFVPVDTGREALPVSGTAVRADPLRHWAFLPRCVRPHFLKRVSIFGPESTGKTTLARALARRFGTVAAPAPLRSKSGRSRDVTI
jgi:HTH-type transcriptional regulator, transcriptional repressor of NAD biosynthesis genes